MKLLGIEQEKSPLRRAIRHWQCWKPNKREFLIAAEGQEGEDLARCSLQPQGNIRLSAFTYSSEGPKTRAYTRSPRTVHTITEHLKRMGYKKTS